MMRALGSCLCIFQLLAVSQAGPGLLIPLYTYPSVSTWEALKSAASSNPSVEFVAIVNPNSGPGSDLDSTYVTGIDGLTEVGVKCIGYVRTDYGAVATDTVTANMDKYTTWYPKISGFFLDEMAHSEGKESYYASLTAHAVATGKPFTIGNPGTSTTRKYFDTVNNTVIYETSKLPQLSALDLGFPSSGCSMIAYDVAASQVNQSYVDNVLQYTSLIYITDDKLDNPYDSLPTYFNQLVDHLRVAITSKH
ncbi:spherulin-4 [Diachasma alloeum]|uniref:spherulin-4 n=1 Tax=Diachasma alloeum TaxID=454923 RepID=UPI000738178D|nr:spherulin-4 [Diachasma alloeum]XP_015117172.1 spherulin-4 [Diachasma alloeum]